MKTRQLMVILEPLLNTEGDPYLLTYLVVQCPPSNVEAEALETYDRINGMLSLHQLKV